MRDSIPYASGFSPGSAIIQAVFDKKSPPAWGDMLVCLVIGDEKLSIPEADDIWKADILSLTSVNDDMAICLV